ncbi:hypothetical protein [Streptomyces stelliscabiei]|uniref:hypothetical protein n=1 Tax=Streptomyces stelliscabiei TaxID=146820 RepID=UPI00133123B8|nr:hypothetical protein [Streptomyces stelliscabiei]
MKSSSSPSTARSASALIRAVGNVGAGVQSSGRVRPQGVQRAVCGLVELGDDVGDHVAVRKLQEPFQGEGAGILPGGDGQRGVGEPVRVAVVDLVPGRRDQHPGQGLLFVVGPVHGQLTVVELQAKDGLLQARGEFLAHFPHPPARIGVVRVIGGGGEHDAGTRDLVDGLGSGERQAQPVVDRGADVPGLGADTGARQQDLGALVPGAKALAQQVGAGRQFAVEEAAQRGARTVDT